MRKPASNLSSAGSSGPFRMSRTRLPFLKSLPSLKVVVLHPPTKPELKDVFRKGLPGCDVR